MRPFPYFTTAFVAMTYDQAFFFFFLLLFFVEARRLIAGYRVGWCLFWKTTNRSGAICVWTTDGSKADNTVGNIYIFCFEYYVRKARPFVCGVLHRLHTNDEVKLNEG